jgi:Arc/MetJ-type ribon-helix-helix transcriptional regulator
MTTTKIKTKKKTSLKRTTIFLTEEHHEALRRLAFERRTSMARLIREAVLEMLEDDEDIKAIQQAEAEGDQEYITLEEAERRWSESHKAK